MVKVMITGASGMIGSIIQQQCLHSDRIEHIVSLTRRPSGAASEKLNEVIVEDFSNLSGHQDSFKDVDVAFFCLGVYTGAVSPDKFREITVDYTIEFVDQLATNSPGATICFLSGSGADNTEKSRVMFARDKGAAENYIKKRIKSHYLFRPAYIYPVTPREEPNLMYKVSRLLYPIIKLFGKNASITSVALASAMMKIGLEGYHKTTLENKDIVEYLESAE